VTSTGQPAPDGHLVAAAAPVLTPTVNTMAAASSQIVPGAVRTLVHSACRQSRMLVRPAAPRPSGRAEDLLEQVWDEHADPFTSTVTVTIGRLRRKLGDPPLLTTTPTVGYRIADP
jgi:hypothetical protein